VTFEVSGAREFDWAWSLNWRIGCSIIVKRQRLWNSYHSKLFVNLLTIFAMHQEAIFFALLVS
jgi:hypothetical protein